MLLSRRFGRQAVLLAVGQRPQPSVGPVAAQCGDGVMITVHCIEILYVTNDADRAADAGAGKKQQRNWFTVCVCVSSFIKTWWASRLIYWKQQKSYFSPQSFAFTTTHNVHVVGIKWIRFYLFSKWEFLHDMAKWYIRRNRLISFPFYTLMLAKRSTATRYIYI